MRERGGVRVLVREKVRGSKEVLVRRKGSMAVLVMRRGSMRERRWWWSSVLGPQWRQNGADGGAGWLTDSKAGVVGGWTRSRNSDLLSLERLWWRSAG